MRNEWFNNKIPKLPSRFAYLLVFAHVFFNPCFNCWKVCVYFNQSQLATPFDQLVWLYYKFLEVKAHQNKGDLQSLSLSLTHTHKEFCF